MNKKYILIVILLFFLLFNSYKVFSNYNKYYLELEKQNKLKSENEKNNHILEKEIAEKKIILDNLKINILSKIKEFKTINPKEFNIKEIVFSKTQENNIFLNSFEKKLILKYDNLEIYKISISLSGNLSDFSKFLESIKNFDFEIKSLIIDNKNINFTLEVYLENI